MSLKQSAGIANNTKVLEPQDLDTLANIYREFGDEVMIFTADDGAMFFVEMFIHVDEISSMDEDGEMWFDWDMLKNNWGQVENLLDIIDTLRAELELATGEDRLIDADLQKLKRYSGK